MSRLFGRNATECWIDLLERAYSLDGTEQVWLEGILGVIATGTCSRETAAYSFDARPSGIILREVAVQGAPELKEKIRDLVRHSSAQTMELVFRSGRIVATLSEYVWPRDKQHAPMFQKVTEGPPDVLGVVAHSGDGRGVVLNMPLQAPRKSTAGERRRWMRAAAHIGAARRLRQSIPQLENFDSAPIEAVFDGSGKVHDAREGAVGRNARQILRNAVRHMDTIRSASGRQGTDDALESWEALVHGRWSLIDKFDTDQRRFVVAVRNDPRFADPRGLSLQERQVAEYTGLGRSTKEIAYILGVPAASAENSARRAQAKLGLNSRVELASFFSPQGIRARLAEIVLEGDSLLVGAGPALDGRLVASLTTAERSVLALIIAGSSNSDIARRRATSVRTVANQVQNIFHKTGARSRCELISRVAAGGPHGVGF